MRITKIFAISSILLAAAMSTGCNSIFRETPFDKLAEEQIWGDEKLLDEYTGSWYRNMDNGFYILVSTMFKNLGSEFDPWFGDQITVGRSDWYQAGYGELLKGSHSQITSRSRLVWQGAYEQIRSVNKLIEHEAELPRSIHDRILGEAYFFRAWYHYKLLRRYGGVLLVDRTFDPLTEEVKFPRASFEQTVEFIVADAKRAAALLPAEHETRDVGRITKGAAWTLAGKTYFWAAGDKFQNADKEFLGFTGNKASDMRNLAAACYDEMLKLNIYDLIPANAGDRDRTVEAYRNIFLTKNSQESILEVQHSDDGNFSQGFGHKLDRDAAPPSMTGVNCAYNPTQNHVDEYRMANGLPIDDPNSGYDEDFPYDNRDVRFYANVLYDGAMWKGHKMELHYTMIDGVRTPGADIMAYGTSSTASYTRTGYYMAKFLRETQQIDADETYGSSQNYIIWRLAEILLDYAEIDWLENRPEEARKKVNRIRSRVGMPAFASITFDDINNERRVELAFEKTTYWDLLRNGTAETAMCGDTNPLYRVTIVDDEDGNRTYSKGIVNGASTNVRYFASYHYFWPIAWSDIRYHGIEQNPEWIEM
ncbi:MAG: RagB/SusD family nutrient uptake outer membrane protein [Bacteroides sp.]|nr:RagB/SusD family nutrient uptake outer membrane protein [Bacteroides sp.]